MTQKEIIKGNKLIAEFIGFVRYFPNLPQSSDLANVYIYPKRDDVFHESLYVMDCSSTSVEGKFKAIDITRSQHIRDIQFHKSWSLLMPVVEKIESISSYFEITFKECKVWKTNGVAREPENEILFWIQGKSKIGATYKAVIEFIKYYNKNK